MFVGRESELSALASYMRPGRRRKPLAIIAPPGMGKTALIEKAMEANLGQQAVHRLSARPFSNPMEVVRRMFRALGWDFDREFGCGFSEVIVLTKGGLVAARASRKGDGGIDEDIFGGMLTAIKSFIEDSFGGAGERGLGRLEYEDMKIIIRQGKGFSVVGIVDGPESPAMSESLSALVNEICSGNHGSMETWDGNAIGMAGIETLARQLLETRWPAPSEGRGEAALDIVKIAEVLLGLAAKSEDAIFIVEDCHWLSRDQQRVLSHFARGIEVTRVGVIVSSRPFEGDFLSAFEPVQLQPLRSADILGMCETRSMEEADELARTSGGNPLFLMELLKLGPNVAKVKGVTLEQLVSERLHSLGAESFTACEFASAMGQSFSLSLLDATAGPGASGHLDGMDFVTKAGGEGRFVHAAYQSAIYDSISQFRRSHVHDSIARAIPLADVFQKARHSLLAGRDASCIEWGMKAGKMASDGFDHELALWYLKTALSLSHRFRMDDGTRCRLVLDSAHSITSIGDTEAARQLLVENGKAVPESMRGSYIEALANVEWFLTRTEEAYQHAREAITLPLTPQELSTCLGIIMDYSAFRGEGSAAVNEGVSNLQKVSEDKGAYVSLLLHIAHVHEVSCEYARALEYLVKAMEIAKSEKNALMMARIENAQGIIECRSGHLEKAKGHLQAALEQARKTHILRLEIQSLLNLGNIYLDMGDLDKSYECFTNVVAAAHRGGYRDSEAMALTNISHNLAYRKRLEESIGYADRAAAIFEDIGSDFHLAYCLWSKAETEAELGRRADALLSAQRALDASVRCKSEVNEIWSWYIIGLVNGETGDIATAREALKVAASRYASVGSASENAQIHAYWAKLEAKRGDPDVARSEFIAALELYRKEGIEDKAAELEKDVAELLRLQKEGK